MRCLVAVALWLAVVIAPAVAGDRPRHVVVIIADDLGRDISPYGNKALRTPNLDALARRGTLFTRAYATVSSCSPSRASILTGLYTHQNGQYGLQHPPHNQQTNAWVQSLANLLRAAGYWTGLIGKFHVAPDSVYHFHQVLTKGTGGNRDVVAMAQRARGFVAQREQKPFFLVYAFADPHRAAKGFANEQFAKDPAEVRYDPDKVVVPYHLPDTPEVRQELAEYYQSVSRMDRGVGLLLEALREAGVLEDTLILFLSDNGIPFPGAKTTLYAAGIHLPLIVVGPGQPSGRSSDAMVSYIDLAPTILDWSKGRGPQYKLPGQSLLPLLTKGDDATFRKRDAIFASHQMHEITMPYPCRAICTAKHKLIVNLTPDVDYPFASDLWGSLAWQGILKRSGKRMGSRSVASFVRRPAVELYDLAQDPNELRNVAADSAYGEVLANLQERLQAWREETKDPWLILERKAR